MRLNHRLYILAVVTAAVAGVTSRTLSAQTDPQIGVWKLNLAKSTFNPVPVPGPKGGSTTVESAGKGTKVSVVQELVDGTRREYSFTGEYDGKDVPIVGAHPDGDSVSRTRVNASTVKTVLKKAGKVTTTQVSVVSSDGKTRTITTTGMNGQGQTVHHVTVYERQ
jgi:hypothetical protein